MTLFLYNRKPTGVQSGDLTMTYSSIYQDVIAATDCVHAKNVSHLLYIIISDKCIETLKRHNYLEKH
jgi:hypothetical protein